jgi:hypothetical protein
MGAAASNASKADCGSVILSPCNLGVRLVGATCKLADHFRVSGIAAMASDASMFASMKQS